MKSIKMLSACFAFALAVFLVPIQALADVPQATECRLLQNEINILENQIDRVDNELNANANRVEALHNKIDAINNTLDNFFFKSPQY